MYLSGYGNCKSILDDGFAYFYMGGIDLVGHYNNGPKTSAMHFRFLPHDEKKRQSIPEDYQKIYELYKRIKDVFASTDNMKEILCPDLVRVIASKDFYKKFGNSFNKNKKLCPEKLFKEYRKDNTKSDDTSIDL